jgi:3-methyladenine DNA glycosylase/8-oxoguanine DNA glycosylase
MRSDATRFFRDGVLTLAFKRDGEPALARVRQLPDASLALWVESREARSALDHLRFILAVDADHTPFLRRFRDDPALAGSIRSCPGLRPLRVATVTHALLKAVCGQLIQAKAARLLEARLLRLASEPYAGLRLPPTRATFARFSPAELERHGLVSRKANALVRVSREQDPERLREVRSQHVAARLERERGLGPWSAAMVALHGLGRYDLGLVGDLGLIKLCSRLRGRWAEPDDTRELLEPYGDWAGLASVYLLADSGRAYGPGLVPATGRGRRSRPGAGRRDSPDLVVGGRPQGGASVPAARRPADA